MAEHNDIGRLGENIACTYLENKGYKILDKNWRWKKYEIDIVALQNNILVFIEVKTRQYGNGEFPEDIISHKKEKQLIEAANAYIERKNTEYEAQIDVIYILLKKYKHIIKHIKEALTP